jgi:hypothetical protein
VIEESIDFHDLPRPSQTEHRHLPGRDTPEDPETEHSEEVVLRLKYRFGMRFNHMELTFARDTLTAQFREEIDAFYGAVFGWGATDAEVVGQFCHILLPDPDQFILLAESGKPMSSPGFDHLGLLQDSRAEVDDLLEACKRYRDKDDRVQIQEYEDLVYPGLTVHAYYVKYLLPIYFDVQSMDRS